ncbi:MAG: ATP-binding protein [Bacteroidota bacterium]|jgi:serine/threonine-protein kinase RsbW
MKEGFAVIDSLEIRSDFQELPRVEALVDKVCNDLGVNEDFYGNVLIAVTEAVNNAIEHGNQRSEILSVEVAVGDGKEEFCFSVEDNGNGFDYTNLPDPTAPENILKENGRGIFLMKNLADELVFENGGRKVNIYFVK